MSDKDEGKRIQKTDGQGLRTSLIESDFFHRKGQTVAAKELSLLGSRELQSEERRRYKAQVASEHHFDVLLERLLSVVVAVRKDYGSMIAGLNASWAEMCDEAATAQLAAEEMFVFGLFLREKLSKGFPSAQEQIVVLDQMRQTMLAMVTVWTSGEREWGLLDLVVPVVAHMNAAIHGWSYLGGGATGSPGSLQRLYELEYHEVDWSSYDSGSRKSFLEALVKGYRQADLRAEGVLEPSEVLPGLREKIADSFWRQEKTPAAFFVPGASVSLLGWEDARNWRENVPPSSESDDSEEDKPPPYEAGVRCMCGRCTFCYYSAALARIVTKIRAWSLISREVGTARHAVAIEQARACVTAGDCAAIPRSGLMSLFSSSAMTLSFPLSESELLSASSLLLFEEGKGKEAWGGQTAFLITLHGESVRGIRQGGLQYVSRAVSDVHRIAVEDCVPAGYRRGTQVVARRLGYLGNLAFLPGLASNRTVPSDERQPLDHSRECGCLPCRMTVRSGWYHRRGTFIEATPASSWMYLEKMDRYFQGEVGEEAPRDTCGEHLRNFFERFSLREHDRESFSALARSISERRRRGERVSPDEERLYLSDDEPKRFREAPGCDSEDSSQSEGEEEKGQSPRPRRIPFSVARRKVRAACGPASAFAASTAGSGRLSGVYMQTLDEAAHMSPLPRTARDVYCGRVHPVKWPEGILFPMTLPSGDPLCTALFRVKSDPPDPVRQLAMSAASLAREKLRRTQESREEASQIPAPLGPDEAPEAMSPQTKVESKEKEEERGPESSSGDRRPQETVVSLTMTPRERLAEWEGGKYIESVVEDRDEGRRRFVFQLRPSCPPPGKRVAVEIASIRSSLPLLKVIRYSETAGQRSLAPGVILSNLCSGRGGLWMTQTQTTFLQRADTLQWEFHTWTDIVDKTGDSLRVVVEGLQASKKDGTETANAILWGLFKGTLRPDGKGRRYDPNRDPGGGKGGVRQERNLSPPDG